MNSLPKESKNIGNRLLHQDTHKQKKFEYFNLIHNKILKNILSYLNILELTISTRVNTKWRRIIQKEDDLFLKIDLLNMTKKRQSLNFIKIISRASQLNYLSLPDALSGADNLSYKIFD